MAHITSIHKRVDRLEALHGDSRPCSGLTDEELQERVDQLAACKGGITGVFKHGSGDQVEIVLESTKRHGNSIHCREG